MTNHRAEITDNLTLEGEVVFLKGTVNITRASGILQAAEEVFSKNRKTALTLNLIDLEDIDSAGAAAIHALPEIAEKYEVDLHFKNVRKTVQSRLDLFKPVIEKTTRIVYKHNFIFRVGQWADDFLHDYVKAFLSLASEVLSWSFKDLFHKKQRRKGEIVNQAIIIGVNAFPIVMSMSFIIGLVMALQSSAQLRNFGANIYIVDLTVIAMMAEMGPLITAILVAGRSGSAIAAEIATMKVTSEIDALRTMGIHPLRFIVVPKIYGSLITMPFLTIMASVSGIVGGAVVAYFYLDITPAIFFNRIPETLFQKDIFTSLLKSIVFALIIVITGVFFGFKVDKGAEGVGKSTTSSVVAAISLVIIADSILGVMLY
ncbi:MAG: ABC transporter permease [Desulforhopalus sp.]